MPTPALPGQERALSPAWGTQAPQKQQEAQGAEQGRVAEGCCGGPGGTATLCPLLGDTSPEHSSASWGNLPPTRKSGCLQDRKLLLRAHQGCHISARHPQHPRGVREGMCVTAWRRQVEPSIAGVFSAPVAAAPESPTPPLEPGQQLGRAVICCSCGFTGHVTAGHSDFPALSN